MSGFYEVTAASGCGGGRRVHEKAPLWAGCCVSHPAADQTLTGRRTPPPTRPSRGVGRRRPVAFSTRPTGSLRRRRAHHTHRAGRHKRSYTAVAQRPEALTGSVLRVGLKSPKVIAR